jgi:hypothetical protein
MRFETDQSSPVSVCGRATYRVVEDSLSDTSRYIATLQADGATSVDIAFVGADGIASRHVGHFEDCRWRGDPFEGENNGHHTAIGTFVDAVAESDPGKCRSSYADAAETFAVTLAVTEAVDADGTVEMSLLVPTSASPCSRTGGCWHGSIPGLSRDRDYS